MPGVGGMRRRGIASSRASGEPCIGPAPPNGTSVRRRGSWPRSTETTRMPRAIVALATRRMPEAASIRSRPSGSAMRVTIACVAASASSVSSPPSLRIAAEAAEHEIGVGDGRLRAAAAVAGGTRHRLGAARADPQRAALVDPRDRAAAGADRVDVDDRDADRDAVERRLARHLRAAVEHQADVGAGAAHVDRDDVGETRQRARHGRWRRPRRPAPTAPCAPACRARWRRSSARRRPP